MSNDPSKFIEELTRLVQLMIDNGYDGLELKQRINIYLKKEELLGDVICAFGERVTPYYEQLKNKDINYFNNKSIHIYSSHLDLFVNSRWKTWNDKTKLSIFRRLRVMYNIYIEYIKS